MNWWKRNVCRWQQGEANVMGCEYYGCKNHRKFNAITVKRVKHKNELK